MYIYESEAKILIHNIEVPVAIIDQFTHSMAQAARFVSIWLARIQAKDDIFFPLDLTSIIAAKSHLHNPLMLFQYRTGPDQPTLV